MISRLDVRNSSENQQIPLKLFQAYSNSKSALEIVNVPDLIGRWKVVSIKVSVIYPDNSEHTVQASKVKDAYVVSLPACETVGKVSNGFQIIANVSDETGSVVDGFVLGVGDVSIISRAPDGEGKSVKYYLKLTSELSANNIGDVHFDDGMFEMWDGDRWVSNSRLPNEIKMNDSELPEIEWTMRIIGGEIVMTAALSSLNADYTLSRNSFIKD